MFFSFDTTAALRQVEETPVPLTAWKPDDFVNKELYGLVVEAFGKSFFNEIWDFDAALDFARRWVYKNCIRMAEECAGLPYTQWLTLQKACELCEVQGFETFTWGAPIRLASPPDLQYMSLYQKDVSSGITLDELMVRVGLYGGPGDCNTVASASTAAAASIATASTASTAAGVPRAPDWNAKPAGRSVVPTDGPSRRRRRRRVKPRRAGNVPGRVRTVADLLAETGQSLPGTTWPYTG